MSEVDCQGSGRTHIVCYCCDKRCTWPADYIHNRDCRCRIRPWADVHRDDCPYAGVGKDLASGTARQATKLALRTGEMPMHNVRQMCNPISG